MKKERTVEGLKKFFAKMKEDWPDVQNRAIGHVVWAPPITGRHAPHDCTRDVCVIKLDKSKFEPNFKGSVVDLGPELDPLVAGKFDSFETAVFPYGRHSTPFAKGGDSRALIVDPEGYGSPDITYCTLFEWLWDVVIKPEFPEAVLHFEVAED
ncbi:hypothetical protein BV20DRAFT_1120601 [Pilatotrama ljubarskyi]|nr:hypothetical protein BV20DRAFT_1120601 [Pilatotrama ljubarskyi]